jgi:TolB-like protein
MKKINFGFLAALSLASFMASSQPVTQIDSAVFDARSVAISPLPYRYEPIVNQPSATSTGVFNSNVMFLAEQIDRNVILEARTKPTILTNIVSLGNLGESSELGRLIGEHLMHELQLRFWTVSDIRLNRDVVINESGEFALSRDVKKLRDNIPAANVVTGTYTNTAEGVLVSVRVLDFTTGQVMSTAQTRLVKDKFISGLVDKPKPIPVVKLTP